MSKEHKLSKCYENRGGEEEGEKLVISGWLYRQFERGSGPWPKSARHIARSAVLGTGSAGVSLDLKVGSHREATGEGEGEGEGEGNIRNMSCE